MNDYSEDWLPYQLRFSLIGLEEGVTPPDLNELYGIEIQNTSITGPRKDVRQMGVYGAGMLSMNRTQSRVDFVWESLAPLKGLVPLGAIDQAAPLLLDPIRDFITQHSWGRVAFGSACGAEVNDRISGYRQLDERISAVAVDPEGSTDFLYQVNQPLSTEVEGRSIVLNRFQRWSVSKIRFSVVEAEGAEGEIEIPELMIAQVVLDFNTPANSDTRLSGEIAVGILELAVSEAQNIIGG